MKNNWYSLVSVSCEKSFSSYVHIKHNVCVLCLGYARVNRYHRRSTTSCVNIGYTFYVAILVWNIVHYSLYLGTANMKKNKRFSCKRLQRLYIICIKTCIFKFILSGQNKLKSVWKWNETLKCTREKVMEVYYGITEISNIILYIVISITTNMFSHIHKTCPLKIFCVVWLNTDVLVVCRCINYLEIVMLCL